MNRITAGQRLTVVRDTRAASLEMKRVRQEINQLQRRIGVGERAVPEHEHAIWQRGSGPFRFDYLVDSKWADVVAAGRGAEGEEFTTFHGHTFKIYSALEDACDDAANRNHSGNTTANTSFGLVATNDSATGNQIWLTRQLGIRAAWTGTGKWSFFGVGENVVELAPAPGITYPHSAGSLVYVFNNADVEFHNIRFSARNYLGTGETTGCVRAGIASRTYFDNCRFENGTAADGYGIWQSSTGPLFGTATFSHCRFTGSNGVGFAGGTGNGTTIFINCQFDGSLGLVRGISFTAGSGDLQIDACKFQALESAISFIANTASGGAGITGNLFIDNDVALLFRNSGFPFVTTWSSFNFTGNHVYLQTGANKVGVDFSQLGVNYQHVQGVTIDGNSFVSIEGDPYTFIAVKGNDGASQGQVTNSLITANTFRGFTLPNVYPDWDQGPGNEAMHNIAFIPDVLPTPSKISLPDVGNPVGHSAVGGTYTPSNSDDWVDPDPTTVQEALDTVGDLSHSESTIPFGSDTSGSPIVA